MSSAMTVDCPPTGSRRLLGVGIDVVDIAEFERLSDTAREALYRRCFSKDEIAYCRSRPRPAQHFAARFAAKEAAVKALRGVVHLAYWQVEITHASDGAPSLRFWNTARTERLPAADQFGALVSLSHSDTVAAAVVYAHSME